MLLRRLYHIQPALQLSSLDTSYAIMLAMKSERQLYGFTGKELADHMDAQIRERTRRRLPPNITPAPVEKTLEITPAQSADYPEFAPMELPNSGVSREILIMHAGIMKRLTSFGVQPDLPHLTYDNMPVHRRLYSEEERLFPLPLQEVGIKSIEFMQYKDKRANELATFFGIDSNSRITLVGAYSDSQTNDAFRTMEDDLVNPFRPEITLSIDPEKKLIVKASSLPNSFDDPRPDIFPKRPEARFVPSPVTSNDLLAVRLAYGFFQRQLAEVR
jgi:hypothetical protein